MKVLVLIFLFVSPCFAGTVRDYGKKWDYDDAYSLQTFTGLVFIKPIPEGTTVYASFFSSENPGTVIFPPDMKGVTFLRCHLDNIVIPPGNFNVDSSTMTYKVQLDGRDWELDDSGKPVKVLDKEKWEALGYSSDPADIPKEPSKSQVKP